MRFVITWLVIAATLAAATAAAQTTGGTISGHVADGQGLALPGVTVNARPEPARHPLEITTSSNGDYIFPADCRRGPTPSVRAHRFREAERP